MPPLAVTPTLTDEQATQVRALAAAAARVDGVEPLSEDFLLGLSAERPGTTHVLAWAGEKDCGELAAYGQRQSGGGAEAFTHPAHRRRGHALAVLGRLLEEPGTRVWAHGSLPAAAALAKRAGLVAVRALHRMTRPLTPADAAPVALPQGYAVRAFRPGDDDAALVATNAAAFASHPEQGRMSVADLRLRQEQPWFDAAGLLVVEATGEDGIAAFHWTKVAQPRVGEVYVVGVHPRHQGRGLAGPLTRLGLAHLAGRDLDEVELYVDGDNVRALATYRGQGFVDAAVDTMYARARDLEG